MNDNEIDIDVEAIEQAINDMIPGLTNYVHDMNLEPEIASLYKPGLILRDKAFVDASCRVGGMATTHRFAILSNHMADFSSFEHGTNWGLFVAQRESHFKVLDVYEHNGKTQITLLHLLNDDRWRLFKNVELAIPNLSIEDIRARFEAKCDTDVIPELATEEWQNRMMYPIGVNPDGELNSPEPKPAEVMWSISNTSFRQLIGNVVYVCKGPDDEGNWMDVIPEKVSASGIFAYPYIDEQEGLTFRYLCPASISDDGNEWVTYDRDQSIMVILRVGSLQNAMWCPTYKDPEEFEPFTHEMDKNYAPDNPAILELRDLSILDPIRHPLYPDDVQVVLLKQDSKGAELVWMRLCDFTDDGIWAMLLNEPEQDLGVHVGDKLPLAFKQDDDGIEAAVLIDEIGK